MSSSPQAARLVAARAGLVAKSTRSRDLNLNFLRTTHPLPEDVVSTVRAGDEPEEIREAAAHIALLHQEGYRAASEGRRVVPDGCSNTRWDLAGVAVPVPRSEWAADIEAGHLEPGPDFIGVVLRRARGKATWEVEFPLEADGQVFTFPEASILTWLPSPPINAAVEVTPAALSPWEDAAAAEPVEPAGPLEPVQIADEAQPLGAMRQVETATPSEGVSIAVFGLSLAVGATDGAALAALRGFASNKLDIAALEPIRIVKVAKVHTAAPGRHPVVVVAEVSARDKEAIWRAKSKLGPDCPVSITLHQEYAPRGHTWRALPTWLQVLFHLYPPCRPPWGPAQTAPLRTPRRPACAGPRRPQPPPPPPSPPPPPLSPTPNIPAFVSTLSAFAPAFIPAAPAPALLPMPTTLSALPLTGTHAPEVRQHAAQVAAIRESTSRAVAHHQVPSIPAQGRPSPHVAAAGLSSAAAGPSSAAAGPSSAGAGPSSAAAGPSSAAGQHGHGDPGAPATHPAPLQ